MAKWTKRNNPHVWRKAKQKRLTAGGSSKPRKKASAPMPKKKRPSSSSKKSRRGGGRRRKGGNAKGWSLTPTQTLIAVGAAGAYGYLASEAEKSKSPDEMSWFKESPVITPIGRAGTWAAGFGAAAYFGFGRKYTKPIAIGLACAAVLNIGRRGLKLYDTEAEARGLLSAGHDGAGEGRRYMEGSLDEGGSHTGYDRDRLERAAYERGRGDGYAEGQQAGFSAGATEGARTAIELERAADQPRAAAG